MEEPGLALAVQRKGAQDVWDALQQAAPEVAEASRHMLRGNHGQRYANYPGFREWLVTEFALATPATIVAEQLKDIRADMLSEGKQPWPEMNSRQLINARADLESDWRPLRATIEGRIRDVGVVNKNRRLLALQSLAETLADEMFDERDEKSGRLYLIPEYRATLRAIAEEVGELGMQVDERDVTIRGLVEMLSSALSISGMGVQTEKGNPESAGAPYDYTRKVVDTEFLVKDDNLDA